MNVTEEALKQEFIMSLVQSLVPIFLILFAMLAVIYFAGRNAEKKHPPFCERDKKGQYVVTMYFFENRGPKNQEFYFTRDDFGKFRPKMNARVIFAIVASCLLLATGVIFCFQVFLLYSFDMSVVDEATALGIGVPCGLAGIIWGLRELFLWKKAKRVLCAYLEERNG